MSTITVDLSPAGTDWTPDELTAITSAAIAAAIERRDVLRDRASASPCPWWCGCAPERGDGDFAHARTVSLISGSGDDPVETADVAVLLWEPFGTLGTRVDGSPVWPTEKVAIDLADGEDDTPAAVLSAARARSLAAALVHAADLIENGEPRLS